MHIDWERLNSKTFFASLVIVTVAYFVITRIFQDWLYHTMGIDGRPEGLFQSFGPQFSRPEPFEIVLYLAGYVVVPVISYCVEPLMQRFRLSRVLVAVCIGIAFLGVAWAFYRFAPIGFIVEYVRSTPLKHVIWLVATKRIVMTLGLLVLSCLFFVWHYVVVSRKPIGSTNRIERISKWIWPLFFIVTVALIFHPNFPNDPHHYHYYLGSVHELLQGKAILYESSHLYGLMDIYALSGLFSLVPLSYQMFSLMLMVVFTIYFCLMAVFMRMWLRSYSLAIISAAVLVSLLFFFNTSPTRSVLLFPAVSPFRWGLYVIVLFLMLGYERTKRSRYLHIALAISAFSLFWNFDSGLFLSMATLGTVGYITWNLESGMWNIRNVLQKFGIIALEYVGYVAGLFALTNVVNRLVYGSWPHWELFFRESKYFSVGIGMYPLPKIGIFELLFLVYVTVLIVTLILYRKRERINPPLLFLALFGAFSMIYYIGESSWQMLNIVMAPFVLIGAYAYQSIVRGTLPQVYHRIIRSGFAAVLFFGITLLIFKIPVEFLGRNYRGIPERFSQVESVDHRTYNDALYLREHYSEHRIPVISLNDTKLMIASGKVNWFDFYYLFTIYYEEEMQKYIDQVLREKPAYVLIGKEHYRNDQVEYFLGGVNDGYGLKQSLETVEVYELNE